MLLDSLKKADKVVVGMKQTLKAIHNNKAIKVYVACDAEPHIIEEVIEASRKNNIELVKVDSMAELGRACSIKVGAAAACIIGTAGKEVE
ncbi:MAG: L7Ae/L30e/S12e/Gadd45 family ribosomal protein [Dethiobacteria bacterium]|nr:50S ribosomal protein L7Ae-like protein [Bacillota bacterium]